MEEEKKEKGFVIKDRRHFDETGDLRKEEESRKEEQEPDVSAERAGQTSSLGKEPDETAADEPVGAASEAPPPEVNFAGFIFSLSTTAMYHFGDFPDPVTKGSTRNLVAAKQTIDILTLLKSKTEGNLDENEKQLLEGILFELRMRYVKEMARP
jgi:hypothetical protein